MDSGVGFWTQELGLDSGGWGLDSGVRFWTLGLGLDSEIVDGIQGSWVELG